jgi:flagellar motor switch protein FliN/FliY
MATAQAIPQQVVAPARPPNPSAGAEVKAEQALVPSVPAPGPSAEGTAISLTTVVARLPVELDVALPVREFRVRNLLALEPGQVIETQWTHGEDMPLATGDVQLAWSEFEVVDSQLAVRVTRMV